MFQLEAPHPHLQTTTVLPSPQFSDQERLLDTVTRKTAVDGTRYTYVRRRPGRRKLRWTFLLTRIKALELEAFLRAYHASPLRITDHRDRVWLGYFTSNPVEFEGRGRAAPAIPPLTRGELYAVELEFEGVEQS